VTHPYRHNPPSSDPGPVEDDLTPSTTYAPSYWVTFVATLALAPALVFALGGSAGAMVAAAAGTPMLVAWLVDRTVLAKRALRAFTVGQRAGLEAMSRGRLDDAEACFRTLLHAHRGRGGLQAIVLQNIAAVRARRGDAMGALRILFALRRYEPTKRAANVATLVPGLIALQWAQLGNVVEARRWLTVARTEKAPIKYSSNIEALILTREGKYPEAEAAYLREWPDLERVVAADVMRSVRARRAFALESAGGDADAVRRLVDAARPENKAELVYLGEAWSEMRAFLEKHALV
jgi:hypothetical protein